MPVLLFLAFFAMPVEAQLRWGARVGVVDGEPMIGGDLLMPIGSGFYFNPNVEISGFGVSASADAHYDIEISSEAAFWVGGGLSTVIPDGSDLDVGVNLLAGLGTRRGRHILYTQFKATALTGDESVNSLAVGIRF